MAYCYNYYQMLQRVQQREEESKTITQKPWKCYLESKDQDHGKLKDKENNSHVQLKSHLSLQRRKVQNNSTIARETFASYSRVHLACLNKVHTLFLAFHLYEVATANHILKNIPQNYKSLCCMYLAMKYEEIYPVQLAELAKLMKLPFNLDEYRRHEKSILISIGLNLDVQTIDVALEGLFVELNYTKVEEMRSYYFLELTFASMKLYKQFSENDILKAITKLARKDSLNNLKESKEEEATINQITKLIIQAIDNDKGIERSIFKKYQREKYEFVANMAV